VTRRVRLMSLNRTDVWTEGNRGNEEAIRCAENESNSDVESEAFQEFECVALPSIRESNRIRRTSVFSVGSCSFTLAVEVLASHVQANHRCDDETRMSQQFADRRQHSASRCDFGLRPYTHPATLDTWRAANTYPGGIHTR